MILPDVTSCRGFLSLFGALFLACFAVNAIGANWLRNQGPMEFNQEPTRVAKALTEGQGFSNPYATMRTGPTIHLAPLFPFLYAGIIKLFGDGVAGWWVLHILMVGIYALQWTVTALFAVRAGMPRPAAVLAAFMGGLLPIPGSFFKWEALLTGAQLVTAAWLTLRLRELFTVKDALFAGVLWGVTLLTQPVAVIVLIAWTSLLMIPIRRSAVLIVIIVPAFMIVPWMWRDYRLTGHWMFIRGNFGLEAAVSNNDCSTPLVVVNNATPCRMVLHPNEGLQAAQHLVEVGEYAFNRERLSQTIDWVEHNKGRFIELTLARVLLFWFPVSRDIPAGIARVMGVAIAIITALSLPGVVLLWRRCAFAAALLLFGGFGYSLVYYIVEEDFRYRYPTLWMNVVAAAFVLYRLVSGRLSARRRDSIIINSRPDT